MNAPQSRSRPGRQPTFFIVGAPKAGTTTLYEWCGQHRSVYMSPIKEPCFFAPEVVHFTDRARQAYETDALALRRWLDGPRAEPRVGGIVLDWEDYLSLFRDAGEAVALGEASGNYLPSSTAPDAIRTRIPEARIVMILRHPVDRLFSQYASAVGAGAASGAFGRWVDEQVRAEADRQPSFGAVWTGMYGKHLARWQASFPPHQIRVFFYEDYRDRPAEVLAALFAFLGVAGDSGIDITRRHNVTTVPRWPTLTRLANPVKPLMAQALSVGAAARLRRWSRQPADRPSTAERARVSAIYRDDLLQLQTLVDRDLTPWLATD